MSSEVLQLAMLIYTSRHLMLIMPPSATWSCILKRLFVLGFFPNYVGFSAFNNAFNFRLSQQQSCLLISHVIEALILDPQAAR